MSLGGVCHALLETLTVLNLVGNRCKPVRRPAHLMLRQHTEYGIIGCYQHSPKLSARYLDVERDALDDLAVTDPYKAVALDIAALKNRGLSAAHTRYDDLTGASASVSVSRTW
jgi:carbonic anhydrase